MSDEEEGRFASPAQREDRAVGGRSYLIGAGLGDEPARWELISSL